MFKFHDSTIRKRLNKYGLFGRVARRKSLLSKKNMAAWHTRTWVGEWACSCVGVVCSRVVVVHSPAHVCECAMPTCECAPPTHKRRGYLLPAWTPPNQSAVPKRLGTAALENFLLISEFGGRLANVLPVGLHQSQ